MAQYLQKRWLDIEVGEAHQVSERALPDWPLPTCFHELHVVGMEKYDKVIVLDTDVLIRNGMDEPFERQTPAAVRRHPQGK